MEALPNYPANNALTTKPQAQGGAMVEVEQQRAIAETQGAMIIAKRFPRNQIEAMDRIEQACSRPGLAETALYSYARGGTEITGPSIRLAETLAQNYGNLQFGIRELEQRNGESTIETFAWDIETNVRQVKVFQVAHKRHTKKGSYDLSDPRDIYELTANQGARRLRACILGIIPGDIIEMAVKQCEQTLKAKADTSPEALKKLCEAFAVFGVTKDQIEKRIQRRIDTITPAQIVSLRKVYNSMKDGMSTAGDWFEATATPEAAKPETLKDKIKGKKSDKPDLQPADNPPPSPFVQFDEIQKADPDGATQALMDAGFTNEPTDFDSMAKVVECYEFNKANGA
jgi:hypothetical protein